MTALELMGLPSYASKEDVKKRWRQLAKQHHPDSGGDNDQFVYWHEVYTKALEQVEHQSICPACHGSKRMRVVKGFFSMTIPCIICNGTGKTQ